MILKFHSNEACHLYITFIFGSLGDRVAFFFFPGLLYMRAGVSFFCSVHIKAALYPSFLVDIVFMVFAFLFLHLLGSGI